MAETLAMNVKRQRGRPRSDDARQRILDAATAIVSNEDLAQLTIEGIAAKAKVSKQTIYRWWTSAADVAEEAMVSRRTRSFAEDDTGELNRDLDAVLGPTLMALGDGQGRFLRALLLGVIDRDSYGTQFHDHIATPLHTALVKAFKRAIERNWPGEPFDADTAGWQVLGSLMFRATMHRDFAEAGYKDSLIASWVCPAAIEHMPVSGAQIASDTQQPSDDRRARGRPRSDTARRAIIDATLAILMDAGNSGLTIEGIAERAQVSKQTIYRWWPTASHIVAEAIQPASAELHPLHDMGTLRADLLQFLEPILASLTPATVPTMRAFLRQALLDRAFAPVFYGQVISPYWDGVSGALERAVARGELRPCVRPDIVTEQIMGAIWLRAIMRQPLLDRAFVDGVVGCWVASWRRSDPEQRARAAP